MIIGNSESHHFDPRSGVSQHIDSPDNAADKSSRSDSSYTSSDGRGEAEIAVAGAAAAAAAKEATIPPVEA